jgi:hypothetical protein
VIVLPVVESRFLAQHFITPADTLAHLLGPAAKHSSSSSGSDSSDHPLPVGLIYTAALAAALAAAAAGGAWVWRAADMEAAAAATAAAAAAEARQQRRAFAVLFGWFVLFPAVGFAAVSSVWAAASGDEAAALWAAKVTLCRMLLLGAAAYAVLLMAAKAGFKVVRPHRGFPLVQVRALGTLSRLGATRSDETLPNSSVYTAPGAAIHRLSASAAQAFSP